MTTVQDKTKAYTSHQRQNEEGRETDARALLSCASKLEIARNPDCERSIYVEALKLNQRLWTLFQVALCDPDNQLPRDLKILLLNLSRYIDKASFRAIASFQPGVLDSLININRRIAAGLSARQKKDEAPAPQQAAPQATPVMTSA